MNASIAAPATTPTSIHPTPNFKKNKQKKQKNREEREKREQQEIEEKDKLAAARKAELLAQLKALEEGVEDGSSKVCMYVYTAGDVIITLGVYACSPLIAPDPFIQPYVHKHAYVRAQAEEEGLKAELAELEKEAAARAARLEEMERNRKLNVDNIGTVVTDFTSINRREAPPDVLPENVLDVGMGKVALEEKTGAAGSSPATATAAAAASKPAGASEPSGGEAKQGGEGKIKTTSGAAAVAGAGAGKGEVGPPSEMDAAENYNNFALTHEVSGWVGGIRWLLRV